MCGRSREKEQTPSSASRSDLRNLAANSWRGVTPIRKSSWLEKSGRKIRRRHKERLQVARAETE
jgi:hypothetical protein